MNHDRAIRRIQKTASYGDNRLWKPIVEELWWLWQEYALADDAALTSDARNLKQSLLALFPHVEKRLGESDLRSFLEGL